MRHIGLNGEVLPGSVNGFNGPFFSQGPYFDLATDDKIMCQGIVQVLKTKKNERERVM